jgi:hypothetical protein
MPFFAMKMVIFVPRRMKNIERFSKDVDVQLPGSWCK